jgi:glycosyltransferase involved in cell wall biosynthesis
MRRHVTQFSDRLSSLIWRLLARYGKIKYRYLLPIYKLLHLLPGESKAQGTGKPSTTLRYVQALMRLVKGSGLDSDRDQLQMVIERVQKSRGAVIFLPSVGWDVVNTQRCHHLAREFARQGFISIFDSTNAYDDVSGFKEIEANLFLFRADETLLHEIPDALLWTLSYNFDRKNEYPPQCRVIYDWIDDLEVFPYDPQFMESNHARALQESTVVASVARHLHEQAQLVRPDALYLPNGVDERHFANEDRAMPDDPQLQALLQEGKPIAGFYGALAEWFDYELLDSLAALRRDWNFLLIGPAYDLSLRRRGQALLKRPNVHWIGSRKYELLPAYLQRFDVAMIPFLINNITRATSPLKLYEYFAGGKPVITTRMPECVAYPEVLLADDVQEFSAALDLARLRGQDETFRNRLRLLGRENSWTARVEALLKHLNKETSDGARDNRPQAR